MVYSALLRLPRVAADLRDQKINTERRVLVLQEALQLCDLLPKHVWGVANTANDTNTSCVGDGGGELGTGSDVHAGQHDGVVDLEEIGRGGADLLCEKALSACSIVGYGGGLGGIPAYGAKSWPWLRLFE